MVVISPLIIITIHLLSLFDAVMTDCQADETDNVNCGEDKSENRGCTESKFIEQ